MSENEIRCFGCGNAFHQNESFIMPDHYGKDIKYVIVCGWCGWKGSLVMDVKRLEPDFAELYSKWKETEGKISE